MNIDKQTFNTLDVLYDDKKWGKRIDPDEWNANFKVLEEGHNELATKLNQQVTDIDTAIQAATSNGGQNISVQYGVGTETLQNALDNVVSDINNRYTKNEVDATVGSNTNSLIANAEYNESTGAFTFTRKDGSKVVIDTVIEKVPASMALKDEPDGSVSLVITNQDGSTTKTNVTSLIEDTVINSSDTINATSVTDSVKKVTTYTLVIKPNSIGLSHIDSALTTRFEEAQSAKTLAIQAKDNAVAAKTAAETARNKAQSYANEARTWTNDANVSADESADSALEAKGYAEQAASYKNSAELAKVAAEKARDEAQSAVGGDFATKSYVDDKLTGKVDKVTGKQLSTEDYTTAEKNKLSGIAAGANNYTHPSTHPASMITQDSTHMFVTDGEKTAWNNKVDNETGKGLSANDYTTAEKNKVANLPSDTNTALSNKVDKVSGKGLSTNDYTNTEKTKLGALNAAIIVQSNVSVATSAWVSDTTYTDYPYRASIPITGCTVNHIPEVVFSLADALSGKFAPVAQTYAGGVYIYARESADITIPTIKLTKVVE